MGIKVPIGDIWCQWDCPLFPAGRTPALLIVNFSGIIHLPPPGWEPPDVWPGVPNGHFGLEQTNISTWEFSNSKWYIIAQYDEYDSNISLVAPEIDELVYQCNQGPTLKMSGANEVVGYPYGYQSGQHIGRFITEVDRLCSDFAMDSGGKSFFEPVGQSARFAQENQGSCVYIQTK